MDEKKYIRPEKYSRGIKITSDSEFDKFAREHGLHGSGTQSDPYIIEKYEINANGKPYCIYIENTTRDFIIRECELYNAREYIGTGIYLNNVEHAIIENNFIRDCETSGIHITNTRYSHILENTIVGNFCGIFITVCRDNIVSKNKISGGRFGLFMCSSVSDKITENVLDGNMVGIYVSGFSINCKITGNSIINSKGDGMVISYSIRNEIHGNKYKNNGMANVIYFRSGYDKAILPSDKDRALVPLIEHVERSETD